MSEALCLRRLPLLSQGVRGREQHPAGMGILEQQRLQQRFKVALAELFPQRAEEAAHLQVGLRRAAIEPALHHLQSQNQPLGHAKVPLARLEFQMIQRGLHLPVIQPSRRQAAKL